MARVYAISSWVFVAAMLACASQGSARTLRGWQGYYQVGQQGARGVEVPAGTTVYYVDPQQQYDTPQQYSYQPAQQQQQPSYPQAPSGQQQQQYNSPSQPSTSSSGPSPTGQSQQQPAAAPTPSNGQPSPKLSGSDPLDLHNRYRAVHHAQPLTYDTSLESSARSWAQKLAAECAFYHSGPGENLASGFTNWADVMWAWYEEYKQYNYAAPGYAPATGHFTELVWAGATTVGCASATASCWEGTIWACHYNPTGNVNAPQYFRDNVFAP